jgi:hypothetical protein
MTSQIAELERILGARLAIRIPMMTQAGTALCVFTCQDLFDPLKYMNAINRPHGRKRLNKNKHRLSHR